ncbi:uncharacterized protein LOC132719325 [Ruditapes philippinarum]|uniref:uncharacterized protein LOC132719325 n=1 Tax=Ruditapes philippinarum TaxID=129788 RepID=UPI00295C1620|nr:uncharacterized protein LOC132719325 [Ruditapes philippinarum]
MDYTRVANRSCLLIIVYIIFTFDSQFVETLKLEIKCLASRNEKWNKNKNICVTCKDCNPGSFRNLSEPYNGRTGDNGDEQCIPCSPCPDGTFSENGRGECSHCRTNCTEMNREYDSTCSKTQDAKCRNCLTNYEDTYGHFLFPCSPKKEHKELIPPKGETPIRPDNGEKETAGDNPIDSTGISLLL